MQKSLLLALLYVLPQLALAAPATCEQSASSLILFKMKTRAMSNVKNANGDYEKKIDCSKVDYKELQSLYDEKVKSCKNSMDAKNSETRTLDELLEGEANVTGNTCKDRLFRSKLKNLIAITTQSGVEKVCDSFAKVVDETYNGDEEDDCDIAEKGEDSEPVKEVVSSNTCEIPDDTGNCPGFTTSKSAPTAQTGFIQISAPKKKYKQRKTGSLRNGGSSISQ